jgi:hypothetical protein
MIPEKRNQTKRTIEHFFVGVVYGVVVAVSLMNGFQLTENISMEKFWIILAVSGMLTGVIAARYRSSFWEHFFEIFDEIIEHWL